MYWIVLLVLDENIYALSVRDQCGPFFSIMKYVLVLKIVRFRAKSIAMISLVPCGFVRFML